MNVQSIIEPVGTEWYDLNLWFRWVQSSRLNHSISLGFDTKEDVDQWMGNFRNYDENDELMAEVAKGQEPEKPPARVLPFPPGDVEDDGTVN